MTTRAAAVALITGLWGFKPQVHGPLGTTFVRLRGEGTTLHLAHDFDEWEEDERRTELRRLALAHGEEPPS